MDEKCATCGGMGTIDYRTHFGDENEKSGKWMRTPCPTCSDPNKPTEAAWDRKGNVMDDLLAIGMEVRATSEIIIRAYNDHYTSKIIESIPNGAIGTITKEWQTENGMMYEVEFVGGDSQK